MEKLRDRKPEWRRNATRQAVSLGLCSLLAWAAPTRLHAAAVVPPDLSGTWTLNVELSDDLEEKVAALREARRERGGGGSRARGGGGGGRGGGAGGGRGRRGGGRPDGDGERGGERGPAGRMRGLAAAESMSLSWQDPILVVTTPAGERRLDTTGSAVEIETPTGAGTLQASWTKEGRLVVETKRLEGGGKRVEAFELLANGRLAVSVKRSGGQGPGLELTYVYDGSASASDPEPPAPGEETVDDAGDDRRLP